MHAVINIMICLTLPVKNISVLSDRDTQRVRVQAYNDKIEQFILDAAEFYNNQVSEEITQEEKYSQLESVKSQKNYASRLSVSSSKAREA